MFSGERKIPTLGSTVPVGNSASLVSHWNGWTLGLGFSYLHWTPMMDSIYLTLFAWLLIQDKKSTRLTSIVSIPKQMLPAILFNKTRLHWCEFIWYILDSHSFSTKNKIKTASLFNLTTIYLHLTSYPQLTQRHQTEFKARYQVTLPVK